MAFWGMDLEQVRGHADGLAAQAQQLQSLIAQVDGVVDQASWVWPGPDSDAFRDGWHSTYRPALDGAATQLIDAVTVLYRQIEEQALVSGEPVPAGTLGPGGSADMSWLDRFSDVLPWLQGTTGVAGFLTALGANRALAGRYSNSYLRFAELLRRSSGGLLSEGFFRYKGPHNGIFNVNGPIARLASSPTFSRFNLLSGVTGLGQSLFGAFGPNGSTGDRIYQGVDAFGDGLKLSKNPVAYLSGVIVSTGSHIGRTAQEVDWSPEGFQMAWQYASQNPGETAEEFFTSIPKVLGDVL
ncbi:WXG100 family type VII secretion target [Nocardioides pelophilus]|uniref:WXG100 family type VII secretion target n=1 Tax=Nocardioides pelophilus TaxID=2172019 RepID=UPI0015FFCADE|nr:hypothetical protein [Nocardioides pelophilus]